MLAQQTLGYVKGNNSRSAVLILGSLLLSAFSYLAVMASSDKTGITNLYCLGLVQIAPLLFAFARGRFSYLDFVLFNHFIVFTVARLNATFNLDQATTLPPEVILAVEVLSTCTGLIILGNLVARTIFFRRYFSEVVYERLNLSPGRQATVLFVLLTIPLFANFLPPNLAVPILSSASVGFILLFTSAVPLAPKREAWARWLLLLSAVHFFLETGFMSLLAQYAGISFVSVCMRRKVTQVVGLLIFVVCLSAIQSVKADFRIFLTANENASFSERLDSMSELIDLHYFSKEDELDDLRNKRLAGGFARVGDNSLEIVLTQTPSAVPFWNGETYAVIPYIFIPRFLWPEKPPRDFWNKYGRKYGVISEDDFETAVGVGFLAEAYMNYGYIALYVLALTFGFMIALLERCSAYFIGGPTVLAFMVFLLPVLPYSIDLGSMLSSLFACNAVMLVMRVLVRKGNERDAYGSSADAAR